MRKLWSDIGAAFTGLNFTLNFEDLNNWTGWLVMILVGLFTIIEKAMNVIPRLRRWLAERRRRRAERYVQNWPKKKR